MPANEPPGTRGGGTHLILFNIYDAGKAAVAAMAQRPEAMALPSFTIVSYLCLPIEDYA